MKRLTTLLLCLLMICTGAIAQYNTSKVNISFPVRNLPNIYVPAGQRNYSVSCGFARQVSPYITPGEVAAQLHIDGWQMINNPDNASLRITVNAYDFLIEGIHEDKFTEMVPFHGELVPMDYFTPVIDYSIIIEYVLESNDSRKTVTNVDPFTHRPPINSFRMDKRFRSPRDCHDFARENKEVFIEKIIRTEIYNIIDVINEKLVPDYVYYPTTDQIKIAFFSSKKSPYYAKHQSAKNEIKNILNSMPLDGNLASTIRKMQPWIEHFKEIEKSLSSSNKKQKQAKADMVYNLAMIYYALEIFDVSRDYLNRLINEFDDNAGKRLLRNLEKTESEMKRHNVQTRHF
ncbi:MAG: hypothetical protein II075_13025 [Bacteroidales bacterium]|nr:hypothetical protein [Bacteroidales bacterium]